MALQNDPRLYSGGNERVSSQPAVNLYAQHLQRKQAREEALDNYEMNRINRMNEQGVRDIDRPGLDQKVIDMKTYYQANKDKIRKGGTPEAYNYEKMFRDTLGGVSMSKNATAEDETFGKLRMERKKDGRNTPEEWFNTYTKHQQTPVWDEGFQRLPLAEFMEMNAPAYDAAKSLKGYADIQRTPQAPRYENVPGDKFSRNEYIDLAFDDKGKGVIRARAKDEFDKDGGFANQVKNDFSNPVQKQKLEKIFIDTYGAAPQDMSDYAVAKKISELQPVITGKPKLIENKELKIDAANKEWDRRNSITFPQHLRLMYANKQFGIPPPDTGYISDNVAEEVGEDVEIKGQGTKRIIFADKVDPRRLDLIRGRDLTKKQIGVRPFVMDLGNGKFRDYYVQDPITGDWVGQGSQSISREAAKDAYVSSLSPTQFKAKTNTQAQERNKNSNTTNNNVKPKQKKGELD